MNRRAHITRATLALVATIALGTGCAPMNASPELQGSWELTQELTMDEGCDAPETRALTLDIAMFGYRLLVDGADVREEAGKPSGPTMRFAVRYLLPNGGEVTERFDVEVDGNTMTGTSTWSAEGCSGTSTFEGTRLRAIDRDRIAEDECAADPACDPETTIKPRHGCNDDDFDGECDGGEPVEYRESFADEDPAFADDGWFEDADDDGGVPN